MKKSGTTSYLDVDKAITRAELKTGTVGIKVSIMPPNIKLPDDIKLIGEEDTEMKKRVEATKSAVKLPKLSEEGEEKLGTEEAEEIINEEAALEPAVEVTEEAAETKEEVSEGTEKKPKKAVPKKTKEKPEVKK